MMTAAQFFDGGVGMKSDRSTQGIARMGGIVNGMMSRSGPEIIRTVDNVLRQFFLDDWARSHKWIWHAQPQQTYGP